MIPVLSGLLSGCGGSTLLPPAPTEPTTSIPTADTGSAATADTGVSPTPAPRDRLLLGYLAHLQATPNQAQSNGLRGSDLADVCALWDALDPSSKATFVTITARLEGGTLADGSTMLDHVTTAYRVVGGNGATASDPGSCGGGEYNRLLLSIDGTLHAALVAAHAGTGQLDDVPPGGRWRQSFDLAGPHAPFTLSTETDDDLPRGQVHFFADAGSAAAQAPLGRLDLEALVDPFALEIDLDYDCLHNSNPLCDYTFYGAFCLQPTRSGLALYEDNYGAVALDWRPPGCTAP